MTNYSDYLKSLIQCVENTIVTYSDNLETSTYEEGIGLLVDVFTEAKNRGSKVFFIGNGGSAAIAVHMTADFMKNGNMKTCCLYDSSVMTCMGNDYGYEYVFSKQLELLMNENDLLVAISSSGNSMNIVNAVNMAKRKNGKIITMSGFKPDNKIRHMGDYNVYVNIEHYGIVESVHNLILQHVVDVILEKDSI